MNLRGRFYTDENGTFWFRSVKPACYPVPTDGPVGELLRAQDRHPYRPAHLHFLGLKPGSKTLITQVFVDDDEHLESDVVFGVTKDLIGHYLRHNADETPPATDEKTKELTARPRRPQRGNRHSRNGRFQILGRDFLSGLCGLAV